MVDQLLGLEFDEAELARLRREVILSRERAAAAARRRRVPTVAFAEHGGTVGKANRRKSGKRAKAARRRNR